MLYKLTDLLTTISHLSESERLVLAALIEHGEAPAGALAKSTRTKRPTVYLALSKLIDDGLVTRRIINGVAKFACIPRAEIPKYFLERARRQLAQVQEGAQLLSETLTNLPPARTASFGSFTVESLGSERGVLKQMYESLLAGSYRGIFNPQVAVTRESKSLIEECLRRLAKTRPSIQEIAVAGPLCDWYKSQIRNPNHHLKILEPGTQYFSDMILVDGAVVLLDYTPKTPAAVRIRQANLYRSFCALFQELWERL
jgi:predicted transcriptional regulator